MNNNENKTMKEEKKFFALPSEGKFEKILMD
jgi:hypothetical protein